MLLSTFPPYTSSVFCCTGMAWGKGAVFIRGLLRPAEHEFLVYASIHTTACLYCVATVTRGRGQRTCVTAFDMWSPRMDRICATKLSSTPGSHCGTGAALDSFEGLCNGML